MKASHQLPAPRRQRRQLARRLLALVLTLGAVPALAQQGRPPRLTPPLPATADTVQQVVDLAPATIDSLAVEPLQEPAVDSVRLVWLQTPATFSEMVSDRMGCIDTQAPHQVNAAVLAYVRLFTERQRGYTQHVLEREQFYFPTFEKYLAQYNLPNELKYLSVVESALIPTAKSPVGAVGLWQFMPATGSDMRLKRDEWVDERMHPEKSTEAACKYLRDLYRMFHDWELVLAAYNWGAGNVQRVMRRTGKHTFWEMYPHMPAETRNYVPTFTAIMYAMKYAPEHSLHDANLRYQHYEPLDTLGVRGQALDLRRLSRALGYADSLTLGRYNPEVRRGGLPAGYRPYVLRFPSAAREHLGEVDRATLLAYCQPTSALPQPLAARAPSLDSLMPWPLRGSLAATAGPRADGGADDAPRFRRLHYTVRRGQTVASVAEKFDVKPSQLRRWNELGKSQVVKHGQQLVVFVPVPSATPPQLPVAPLTDVADNQPKRISIVDAAAEALAAANQRYAREAQASAAREAAQAKTLLRAQKQQAARVAAEQQRAIFQAAALAKAAAAEKAVAQNMAAGTTSANGHGSTAEPAVQPPTATSITDSIAAAAPSRRMARPKVAVAHPREASVAEPIAAKAVLVAQPELYLVRPGDNLTKLAREHSLTLAQLKSWNNLTTEAVAVGQRLRLVAPPESTGLLASAPAHRATQATGPALKMSTHTVEPGDTLFSISRRFKMSVEELRQLNHLTGDEVKLGQKLVVRS